MLLRVCIAAGQDFVSVEECVDSDGKTDLRLRMDRSKIESVGKPAIADLLLKLQVECNQKLSVLWSTVPSNHGHFQVYKSTGNVKEGSAFFRQWTAVGEDQLRWRDIVIARRQPHRLLVQPNTLIDDNGALSSSV